MPTSDEPHRSPRHLMTAAIALVALIGAAIYFGWTHFYGASNQTLPAFISAREAAVARESFRLKNNRAADQFDILNWEAERMLEQKKFPEAVKCFDRIPTSHPRYGRMARYREGVLLIALFRAVEAERHLREVISLEEATPSIKSEFLIHARQRLRHILEVEVRFEERHHLLRGVIDRNEDQSFEPVAGCFPSLLSWNGPDAVLWIEHFQQTEPENSLLNIALAQYRTVQGKLEESRRILESTLQTEPANLSALGAMLACLRELNDQEKVSSLYEALPARSAGDPWNLLLQRGFASLERDNLKEAAGAFEQLLQADRTNKEAWHGLSQVARLLNDGQLREKATRKSIALAKIQSLLGKAIYASNDPESFLEIADVCADISLHREGAVMIRCARRIAPQSERVIAALTLFRNRLSEDNEAPLLGK